MEYSIQQLSNLSGVTTRTLRWYDEIDLLKPCRVSESGYRYYSPAEVDRLQDILYYRALGVELARIKDCLDNPSFDRLVVLYSHLEKLQEEKVRLEQLIRSVQETIGYQERNEIMNDRQKFEALKLQMIEDHEAAYGKEAREKYGDSQVDEGQAAMMNLTREQYCTWEELGAELQKRLETAVRSGLSPESEEGKAVSELHRKWLCVTTKQYTPAKHRGIVMLYTADERFTSYYDKQTVGCAQFLQNAVLFWIK